MNNQTNKAGGIPGANLNQSSQVNKRSKCKNKNILSNLLVKIEMLYKYFCWLKSNYSLSVISL